MSTDSTGLNTDAEELNGLFRTLTDEHARQIVAYFQETDAAVVAFDDLVDSVALAAGPPIDRERVALRLHHVSLPKLADSGCIEYDPGSQTVEYLAPPALADIIETGVLD